MSQPMSSRMLVLVLALAAACSDSTGTANGGGNLSIAFTNGTGASSANALAPDRSASLEVIPVSDGRHSIDIQSALVTFARLDLDRDRRSHESDDDDEQDVQPISATPVSVDLVSTTASNATLNVTVPAGSYDDIEGRVKDIRVRGNYDGKPFDVTITIDVKFQADFSPPLAVTGNEPLHITVAIDPTMWFRNASGAVVDPTLATVDGLVRAQIRTRIRAAFHAFRDENRDGHDDGR